MSDALRDEGKKFAAFLKSIPPEELDRIHREQHEESKAEHDRFSTAFASGDCYLCESQLSSFDRKVPCLHWLLRPKGFAKKDLALIGAKYGVFQIQSYLRWVANEEARASNINDLVDEFPAGQVIGLTIRYGNLEWSISCRESDYMGHPNAKYGNRPHYHFQMRIDGRPFINYNDFHLDLHKMDVINIAAMRTDPERLRARWSFGHGMQDVLSPENLEHLISSPVGDEDDENAPLKLDTFIIADEGTTISGEAIYEMIQKAKAEGTTVASLAKTLPNVSTTVIVSPGRGVVEAAPREGGRAK
jgi:hypothetical protein